MLPRFGAHTYSFTLRESVLCTLPRLADLGFTSFELMAHPGHLWPAELTAADRSRLCRMVDELGGEIVALNMPNVDINIAATTDEMRRHTLALLSDLVRLAGDLGASGVIMGPGKANPLLPAPRDQLVSYFRDGLEQLSKLAATHGTEIWIENMPFSYVTDARGVIALLDGFGDSSIGAVFDFANAYFVGEGFADGLESMRARLRLVHVSDTHRNVFEHAALGAGTMPIGPIPALLAATGYAGPVMLEVVSREPETDLVESRRRLESLSW
ncbi:MAG TPA: sugar phosphate isomerase/epimerase family protein [Beijerinckiaceae bacterium]|jgi:sugar phosphate isomerase/epimerase